MGSPIRSLYPLLAISAGAVLAMSLIAAVASRLDARARAAAVERTALPPAR